MGVPGDDLDEVLWLTCLDEDLDRMPDGAATVIGPKGLRLSGGQIQRAGAARPWCADPTFWWWTTCPAPWTPTPRPGCGTGWPSVASRPRCW